jgi:hypothetical protein
VTASGEGLELGHQMLESGRVAGCVEKRGNTLSF